MCCTRTLPPTVVRANLRGRKSSRKLCGLRPIVPRSAERRQERLTVQQPFEERFTAGKLELTARLTSEASIGFSAKVQRNLLTHRDTTTLMLQAAFKTVR